MGKEYVTKYNGITGLGAPSVSEEQTAEEKKGSFYGGLKVSPEVMKTMKESSAANFLSFTPASDNSEYIVKAKLPEKAVTVAEDESKYGVGKEYSVRKNVNLVMKAYAKGFVDSNNEVNLVKACDVGVAWFNLLNEYDEKKMYDKLKDFVTEEEWNDFKVFASVPVNLSILNSSLDQFDCEMRKISTMPKYLNSSDSEKKKIALESNQDYKNIFQDYIEMASMDPDTNEKLFWGRDCVEFAFAMDHFSKVQPGKVDNVPTIEKNRDDEKQDKNIKTYGLKEYIFAEEKEGKMAHFKNHGVMTFPINLEGEEKTLVIETTAAPVGKLFFHPTDQTVAVGIYDDVNEIENHYEKDNYKDLTENVNLCNNMISNLDGYNEMKSSLSPYSLDVSRLKETEGKDILHIWSGEFAKGNTCKDYYDSLKRTCVNGYRLTDLFGLTKDSSEEDFIKAAENIKHAFSEDGLKNGEFRVTRENENGSFTDVKLIDKKIADKVNKPVKKGEQKEPLSAEETKELKRINSTNALNTEDVYKSLKSNVRKGLFGSKKANSPLYESVLNRLENIRKLEENIKNKGLNMNTPEGKNSIKELTKSYKELEKSTEDYLKNRTSSNSKAKERQDLIRMAGKYAHNKISDLTDFYEFEKNKNVDKQRISVNELDNQRISESGVKEIGKSAPVIVNELNNDIMPEK